MLSHNFKHGLWSWCLSAGPWYHALLGGRTLAIQNDSPDRTRQAAPAHVPLLIQKVFDRDPTTCQAPRSLEI